MFTLSYSKWNIWVVSLHLLDTYYRVKHHVRPAPTFVDFRLTNSGVHVRPIPVFERTRDFEVKESRSSVPKTERGIQGFGKMCDNQLVSVTSFPGWQRYSDNIWENYFQFIKVNAYFSSDCLFMKDIFIMIDWIPWLCSLDARQCARVREMPSGFGETHFWHICIGNALKWE